MDSSQWFESIYSAGLDQLNQAPHAKKNLYISLQETHEAMSHGNNTQKKRSWGKDYKL